MEEHRREHQTVRAQVAQEVREKEVRNGTARLPEKRILSQVTEISGDNVSSLQNHRMCILAGGIGVIHSMIYAAGLEACASLVRALCKTIRRKFRTYSYSRPVWLTKKSIEIRN